jgi:hypothetical protein
MVQINSLSSWMVFYEKAHIDNKGILAMSPFLIAFAFLNLETRKKS